MGGGLFGTPLYINEKCIAFSAFVIAVYFLPHQKYWQHEAVFVFILAMFSYVLMAWYDYIYDCNDKLGPTFFGLLLGWAKPYGGVPPGFEPLPIKYKKIVAAFDIVVLIVLVSLVFAPYTRIHLSR
jgi:hypothetical protein